MYTYGFFFLSYYPKRVSMNGCFLNESINLCCATPVVCDVIGRWREEAGLTGLNGGRWQETGNNLPKEGILVPRPIQMSFLMGTNGASELACGSPVSADTPGPWMAHCVVLHKQRQVTSPCYSGNQKVPREQVDMLKLRLF